MNDSFANIVFENESIVIKHADFCNVPGYLILRFKTGVQSPGDLEPEEAKTLGLLLSFSAAAIKKTVAAERIYVLSFCELDRRLHFHLFPRTAALLELYHQATGTLNDPINGPMLFEWARERFKEGVPMPKGFPAISEICARIGSLISLQSKGLGWIESD